MIGRGWLLAAAMLATFVASGLLFRLVPSELAPAEDRGDFNVSVSGPEGAGFDYMVTQMDVIEKRLLAYSSDNGPVSRVIVRVPGGFGGQAAAMNTGRATLFLKPWEQRDVSTQEVMEEVRNALADIPGVRITADVRQAGAQRRAAGAAGAARPDLRNHRRWRDRMLARMEENPRLLNVDSDYKETLPQVRVEIDKDRAADLGVPVQAIGSTLQTMLGSLRAGTYEKDGEEYYVIMQAPLENRRDMGNIAGLYVRSTTTGQLIPLSNPLVRLTEYAEAGTLSRFNRMRAITLSAGLSAGVHRRRSAGVPARDRRRGAAAGGADRLQGRIARVHEVQRRGVLHLRHGPAGRIPGAGRPVRELPASAGDHADRAAGHARRAARPVHLGASLNLYSQIGIVMLVGLAAKNGILIVEFANQLRDEGMAVGEAIVEASAVRLRPILMTSVAMICGAIPLMLSSGAGAASRESIGVVVVFGVAFSTLLSLFVVPAFYALLAPYTRSPDAVAHELAKLDAEVPPVGGHG